MRHLIPIVFVLFAACGEDAPGEPASEIPGEEAPPEATPEAPEATPEAPPEETPEVRPEETPEATSDAAPICERARACCRAYVDAIPSARRPLEERGCIQMDAVLAEAGDVADEACEAAIGGWRQSLQLTGLEVPEPCR